MLTSHEIREVKESGIDKKYAKIQKYSRLGRPDIVQDLLDEILEMDANLINNGRKLFNSDKQKRWRLVQRLKWMDYLQMDACNKELKILFITLTFNDDFLMSNNSDSQRQAVRRYLSSQCVYYVANVDYGAKNGRRHYHAVALVDGKMDFKPWHDKCGAIHSEQVGKSLKEQKQAYRISKYITKLANHAFKDGTLNLERLIYARKSNVDYSALLPF